MSVQSDIAEIRAALKDVEARHKLTSRAILTLHNLLAEKMATHAELLGLDEVDVLANGGGTPKTPPSN